MLMMTSQILKSAGFTKTQNLDTSRTKHHFFFKSKNSLIKHQVLHYDKE